MLAALRCCSSLVALTLVSLACQVPVEVGSRITEDDAAEIARAEKPLDVLVVFDNSGSMCEERGRLIEAFFTPECPIQDLSKVGPEILSARGGEMDDLSKRCGFAQILAAYDNDFRVGVITTDVGPCDNRFGLADLASGTCGGVAYPDPGRRPQRGCLQAPEGWERRFVSRDDPDFGRRFREALESAGEFGSPFERGLDAARVFLDAAADKAPGCEGHLASFLRPEARLVLVFVSDEDDCSHDDGLFGFPDESAGESCEHERETIPQTRESPATPADCHERPELLAPVSRYVEFLRALKEDPQDVSAIVLGGVARDTDGFLGAACRIGDDGAPSEVCTPTFGTSNHRFAEDECELQGAPCCTADAASRYVQLLDGLGARRTAAASVCQTDVSGDLVEFCRVLVDPLDLR